MSIEKVTKDHPIFKTQEFRNDIVAFNVMLIIMEQPEAELYSNGIDFTIVRSDASNTIWAWSLSDISIKHRNELWRFIESLTKGNHYRLYIKSVLAHTADLDMQVKSFMYAYHCTKIHPTNLAHGDLRQAEKDDLYVIAGIISECNHLNKELSVTKAENYLKHDTPYLWSDGGDQAVAMAVMKNSAAGYHRIGGVYTRPDCKNMGYEKSLIYKISEQILEKGAVPMLYTSDLHPDCNSMYSDMGYIRCGKLALAEIN